MKTTAQAIPFQTLGLYIEKSIKGTEAFADFEPLPYYDAINDRLVNPDVPFLSENVVSSPFNNKTFDLKRGVHLHFIMPESISQQLPENAAYPPVPNRWLITKNGKESWIVESDFLSKDPLPNQEQVTTIMPIAPYTDNPSIYEKDGKKYYQPFRYLGRCLTQEAFLAKKDDSKDENWLQLFHSPLNMLAYGHPYFSFFYPNCHSVFGFHDPNGTKTDVYAIEGWWEYDSEVVQQPIFKELGEVLEAAEEKSSFNSTNKIYKNSPFDYILECITPVILDNNLTKDKYSIAIGNSPTEAVSALLASDLADTNANNMKKWLGEVDDDEALEYQIEDILEAVQFDFLQQQQVDVSAKFIEARHSKSFTTHNSGKIWDISYEQPNTNTEEDETTLEAYYDIQKIPTIKAQLDDISQTIQQLNYFQKEYDKNVLLIASKEEQLFTSWYRYMICAHPAEGFESTYPDADKVFVQLMKNLCDLHILKKRTFDAYGETLDDQLTALEKEKIEDHQLKLDELSDEYLLVSGPYRIIPKSNTNKALTVTGNSKKNRATVTQQEWVGTENQQWFLQKLEDGYYRLIAKHSNKALDIEGANQNNGARLIQWPYHSRSNQRFDLALQEDGYYKITAKHSGKVIDISGRSVKDGAKVHQWTWHGGDNQRFDLEPVVLDERIETFKNDIEIKIANLNSAIASLELQHQKSFNIAFNLSEVASPRFYLPREPYLLLKRDKKTEGDTNAFYPMFLEWEMAFYPVDDPSDNDFAGYDERFLDDNFASPSDEPDFKWKEGATQFSKGIGIYEGMVLLTDDSKQILLNKFEQAVDGENSLKEGNKEIVNAAIDKLNGYDLIGQKLEGFNDALLQCKQTLQLPIKDPMTSSTFSSVIDLVAYLIGDNISVAPNANNDFNPIRAGGMDVSKVNLIDSFGRYIEVFNENTEVMASEPLMPSIEDHHLFLPPRFTQPVRIDVRWIPAKPSNDDKTLGESNKMIESSPICGWIVPNNLEKSLLVYNQEGEQLGILAEVNGAMSFEPSPYDTDGVTLDDIENIHLRKLVEYYLGHSVLFFYDSLQILNDSLEYIAPDAFAQYPELSIFVNRPIALVRAKITFERMEELATSNNWDLFAEMLNGDDDTGKKFTQGYEDVKIPIRLGDYQQLNDGIIGYWKDGSDTETIDLTDKFYAPISKRYEEEQSEIITSFDEIDIEIQQSLNDDPQYVTMLFDPRGSLNVTTGVTPVKTINIPNELFKDTLRKMQATFLMSPVLSEKDKVQVPVMNSDLFGWNWLQYQATDDLKIITDDLLITKAKFEQGMNDLDFADFIPQLDEIWRTLIDNNWLKIEGDKTIVQRQLPPLDKEKTIWADYENKIRNIVELYSEGIRSVETTPAYNYQEVIEGWLKLTPK